MIEIVCVVVAVTKKLGRVGTPQLNHITMRMPTFPLMSQTELIDSANFCNSSTISDNCTTEYCSCPHVLQVKLNSVVELILVDEGANQLIIITLIGPIIFKSDASSPYVNFFIELGFSEKKKKIVRDVHESCVIALINQQARTYTVTQEARAAV